MMSLIQGYFDEHNFDISNFLSRKIYDGESINIA